MNKRIKALLTTPRPQRHNRRLYLLRAVRELRQHFNESQQAFSNRLGVAVRTVARWERETPPDDDGLGKLVELARSVGRVDLAVAFRLPSQLLREIADELDSCLLLDDHHKVRERLTNLVSSIRFENKED